MQAVAFMIVHPPQYPTEFYDENLSGDNTLLLFLKNSFYESRFCSGAPPFYSFMNSKLF